MSRDQEEKEFGLDLLGFKTRERLWAILNTPSDFKSENYIIFLKEVQEAGNWG